MDFIIAYFFVRYDNQKIDMKNLIGHISIVLIQIKYFQLFSYLFKPSYLFFVWQNKIVLRTIIDKKFSSFTLNKKFSQISLLILIKINTIQKHRIIIINNMQKQSRALVSVPNNPIDHLSPAARSFYQFHGVQMIGSEFPTNLIETLYLKLFDGSYDGGDFLEVVDNEQQQSFQARATKDIPALSNVFIIDHALTFRYPQLRKILKENPQMVSRLEIMLRYYQQEKKLETTNTVVPSPEGTELELQNMELLQLSNVEFPKTLVTLSLMNNRLENVSELIKKLQYLNLKVLWVNGNPFEGDKDLLQYVDTKTRIQLFNRTFTRNATQWGIKYAYSKSINYADSAINDQVYTLNLDGRNIFNLDINKLYSFKNLRSISIKDHEITSEEDQQKLIKVLSIPSLIYLFTDTAVEIRLRQLVKKGDISQQIMNRVLVNKHSFKQELHEGDDKLDAICNSIFRLAGCYRLASTEKLDQSSCWYVNDELGSFISHSDQPNIKIIPFLFAPNNKLDQHVMAFSVFWPLADIKMGDIITRDLLNGFTQQRQRSSRLAAWFRLPETFYANQINKYNEEMFKLKMNSIKLLQKFYSDNNIKQMEAISKIQLNDDKKWLVISDYEYINKYLKHERFEIVSDLDKADIVWLIAAAEQQQWKKYKGKYFINQFPFESCIVLKHNLASTVQTVFGDTNFLMRTYDLDKELARFIGEYYQREKEGRDNLWILKPPNMARSMDMIITDNLPLIIRAMETGPKIAQKYISKPVLRRNRKVDLRYILLVKSISPLTLFLYKNFWIRSANNDYTLDRRQLSTYQTQFTVMNYGNVSNFQQIKYKDFIEQFEKDYQISWSSINEKIKKMLRNVFIAVVSKHPQMHDDKSRAYYGIDIMIDSETMEPKLLQITFSPDCKRACEYYPTFYDEVFETLYLETMSENMERII